MTVPVSAPDLDDRNLYPLHQDAEVVSRAAGGDEASIRLPQYQDFLRVPEHLYCDPERGILRLRRLGPAPATTRSLPAPEAAYKASSWGWSSIGTRRGSSGSTRLRESDC